MTEVTAARTRLRREPGRGSDDPAVIHAIVDATEVTDLAATCAALRVLTEHVATGRWDQIRPPDGQEPRATTMLRLPLVHAVAADGHDDRGRPAAGVPAAVPAAFRTPGVPVTA